MTETARATEVRHSLTKMAWRQDANYGWHGIRSTNGQNCNTDQTRMIVSLVPFGSVWFRLAPSGLLWSPLVPSGSVWLPLVPSGPLWFPLVPSGLLWSPLAPVGRV